MQFLQRGLFGQLHLVDFLKNTSTASYYSGETENGNRHLQKEVVYET